MELYHIHLLSNKDHFYKPNTDLLVDPKKFNNRLYDRIYKANATVEEKNYKNLVAAINYALISHGFSPFGDRVNLGEIINYALITGCSEKDLKKILDDAQSMILTTGTNLREMAMEEYRRDNCPELPSRLHSLFACSQEGVEFWAKHIYDGDTDVYRIDTFDEPFCSNESLLPYESLDYGNKVTASFRYFHPRKKDLNPLTNEYLVQGKVKLCEKVMELRRN